MTSHHEERGRGTPFERPQDMPLLLRVAEDRLIEGFIDTSAYNELLSLDPHVSERNQVILRLTEPMPHHRPSNAADFTQYDSTSGSNFLKGLLMSKIGHSGFEEPIEPNDVYGLLGETFTPRLALTGRYSEEPVLKRAVVAAPELTIPTLVGLSESWLRLRYGFQAEGIDSSDLTVAAVIRETLYADYGEQLCATYYVMSHLLDARDARAMRQHSDPMYALNS